MYEHHVLFHRKFGQESVGSCRLDDVCTQSLLATTTGSVDGGYEFSDCWFQQSWVIDTVFKAQCVCLTSQMPCLGAHISVYLSFFLWPLIFSLAYFCLFLKKRLILNALFSADV